MSFSYIAMIVTFICITGWTMYVIYCMIRHIFRPQTDKQLQIIDAYIDSVAKANDLITVSLPINNEKIYRKLIKKLQQDFQELHHTLRSVKGVNEINHSNFLFRLRSCRYYPQFKNKEIYNCGGWLLSPSETLSLMKEWPKSKLEILKIHKQNILDFNNIVGELTTLV